MEKGERATGEGASVLARRWSEGPHGALLEAAGVGVWEWLLESGVVRASPTFETLHGLEPGG